MTIDNRDAPTIAGCDQTGCTNTLANSTGVPLRQFQRLIAEAGWTWYVDYETVHTGCQSHPVIRNS